MTTHSGASNSHRSFISVLMLLCATGLLAACAKSDSISSALVAGHAVPLSISTQPQDASVVIGQTATFSVTANGAGQLTYQWRRNGANIAGGTAASYKTSALSLTDSGSQFTVMVANPSGNIVSAAATLTVSATTGAAAPTITTQPASLTLGPGSTATFTVVAAGTAPLAYQWLRNGAPVGANSASYVIQTIGAADSGATFTVMVSNNAGTVTSAPATLTVTSAPAIPPAIVTQPIWQAVPIGSTATFSVVASGTAPLTYQWYENGVVINGGTASTYTTAATLAADSGSGFTVQVGNTTGVTVTSNSATLTITHTLALLAGKLGGVGSADGTGSSASFSNPTAVATDAAGNVYIADTNNQVIRMITPTGVVSTIAGVVGMTGDGDGPGASATFNSPNGIAVDAAGQHIYVADTNNDTIRRITMPGAVVDTLAGLHGATGSADGPAGAARFLVPEGVAVDANGNVYVADTGNETIRKITPAGTVSTLAGSPGVVGSDDGLGAAAHFYIPTGVAVDSVTGNVYVIDYLNCTVRMVTSAGVVTTLAGAVGGYGFADGTGSAAVFNGPEGIAIDSAAANLYIGDTHNQLIRRVTLPGGVVTTVAGAVGVAGHADGTGTAAQFALPFGVAVDPSGDVYIADSYNNLIRKVTTPGAVVTTFAGNIGGRGYADGSGGPGGTARFYDPHNIVSDGTGNVFVADYGNNVIRKIAADRSVTTIAGTPGVAGSADGSGSAAGFDQPYGMVVDSRGNLYVADAANNTIRMITPAGVVSTIAGTAGVTGSVDGTGPAAQFYNPRGLAIDATDTLYVTDYGNNTIRRITTPGAVVTTLAGTAGTTGAADGAGPAAQFWGPNGIAANLSTGNLYVADRYNNTIRMITPAGVVTTIAGSTTADDFVDGTGVAAHFYWPGSIAVDAATGDLYVADYLHNAVRRITAGNVVTTVVGAPGISNVVLGPLPGGLSGPTSLTFIPGPALELVISDSTENSVLLATLP
ncbi:MAG TPA: SMP-30/gluconolactonase/LRE family protein [Steroidobacteraceae bacterium]